MYNSYPMDALIFALLQFSLILVGSALKAQCVCVCLEHSSLLCWDSFFFFFFFSPRGDNSIKM